MTDINPLNPPLPTAGQTAVAWNSVPAGSMSLAIVSAARQQSASVLVVTENEHAAYRMEQELRFYAENEHELPVLHFPDWETLPYDLMSPHQDIISTRLALLYQLPRLTTGIVVVAADTLLQRLPPTSYVDAHAFLLKVGDKLDAPHLRAQLETAGYSHVSEVHSHGEYAQRGGLLDLFPMGSHDAYRIELFDDEIESLRIIDPENQKSVGKITDIRILPAREFPMDETGIESFRARYRSRFTGDLTRHRIYQDVSQGITPNGIEALLPLFFENTTTLFDYLPESTLTIEAGAVTQALKDAEHQIHIRHEQYGSDIERPLLKPDEAFQTAATISKLIKAHADISISLATDDLDDGLPAQLTPEQLNSGLLHFLDSYSGRVLLTTDSAGRREMLLERLRTSDIRPGIFDSWAAFLNSDVRFALCIAPLEKAVKLTDPDIIILPEARLLGARAPAQRKRRATRDASAILRDLTDLTLGSAIVHQDHGVGRYIGLQHIQIHGQKTEFLTLEYADKTKLFVPVSSLHLVHRYTGADGNSVPLHRLGSEQWEKARKRAAKRARDAAAELLEIQAKRMANEGVAMPTPVEDYQRFCDQFPFEETPDQAQAIEQVLGDMATPVPMDRVVCGDVGFGKTEVAMRAAFVAAQSGRQVAVLVPTTLLAQQHYQNFSDRFADWPIRIGSISRLGGTKAQQATMEDMANGKLDIVIGTHRLIQKDVKFKNLGLVIVDEEHRFGVRHKEELKKLRANVDLVTLTATPIPRTLNMSLAGLRDLSIIATPPVERLAIKTQVVEWNGTLIREACLREIKRGGQVYFLHNRVEDIERISRELAKLVPEATVQFAHGQMRERELEHVMLDFYHQRFNLLVCTTIVESGIDVPSANTILINRADRLGLAQLHQLRGRVGRSHHRAYAYMIVPDYKSLTKDAQQRLEAIESLGELGAGFLLATQDMEIRGAGELLGEDQSGQIEAVGITMYTDLLERAKRALATGELPDGEVSDTRSCEIDMGVTALLPEEYVPDIHSRLVLYKRISAAENNAELKELQVELIDRFGLLPEAAQQLFATTELKLKAQPLGIKKLEAGDQGGRLIFNAKPNIDPVKIIQLIQSEPATYKLTGTERLHFSKPLEAGKLRQAFVEELLKKLAA